MFSKSVLVVFVVLLIGVLLYNDLSQKSLQIVVDGQYEPFVTRSNDDLAQRLSKAIQIKTISYQDDERNKYDEYVKLHAFMKENFPLVHKNLKREIVANYSLLFIWAGSHEHLSPALFTSHLDVVPVEEGTESKWTYDPFGGVIADGFIWGRGTMDDKVGAIALLEAIEDLLTKGFQPKRTIYIAFGHDEEVSGWRGAYHISNLLQQRGLHFDFMLDEGMIILENAIDGVDKPIALIGTAEKGATSIELSVETEGGHSSQPPATSSIGILSQAIVKLEQNQMPASLDDARGLFKYVTPEMKYPQRLVLSNLWLFESVVVSALSKGKATNSMLRTTTAVTIFKAGEKENVLPARASAIVNFRVAPKDTIAGVVEHVTKTINDDRVKVKVLYELPAAPVTRDDTPIFNTLHTTIKHIFPDVYVAPATMIANTDTRHYWNLTENIFRFMPLWLTKEDLPRIHGTNERLSVRNYGQMVNFYSLFLRNSDNR